MLRLQFAVRRQHPVDVIELDRNARRKEACRRMFGEQTRPSLVPSELVQIEHVA